MYPEICIHISIIKLCFGIYFKPVINQMCTMKVQLTSGSLNSLCVDLCHRALVLGRGEEADVRKLAN